ncbi:MAG: glycerol-3-phosphate dehydrogenase/oxidase [bacterium]|nr:glycerol-3-phosphate dehydrogenase/oxidase [bacterium]
MRTDPRSLHDTTADLLVVGAGIQGAAIARDAAVRGLAVVLCDGRDFAAGTSSRSSKLVHGGLRYLRQGHFALVREALRERELLLRSTPHLVRPLPMLMPFFARKNGVRPVSRAAMRLATRAYSWLAGRSTLPGPRPLTAAAAAQAFPGLRTSGLRSALEFFDAATQDTRLTLANVIAAAESGARVVNHCALRAVDQDGVRLVDRLSGDEVRLRVEHVINAAGPAVDAVRRRAGIDGEDLVRHSRGSHLVLPPRAGETSLAAFLPDGRIQFVIPHREGTICGTTDVDDPLADTETGPPTADLDYVHEALGWLLDPAPARGDIRAAYAGWRALPAVQGPAGGVNREAFTVTESTPNGRMHSVVGGKLTTHRALAERTLARLFRLSKRSPTRRLALPGGDGPREVRDPLWWRHGSRAHAIWELAASDRRLAEPLSPHRPFLVAEAVYAIRNEGVVTLADLLLRRLVDPRGPCLERESLARAYDVFRQHAASDRGEDEITELLREVEVERGDLWAWQSGTG